MTDYICPKARECPYQHYIDRWPNFCRHNKPHSHIWNCEITRNTCGAGVCVKVEEVQQDDSVR